MTTGAICDLLEYDPPNKEVAEAIRFGCCPNCGSGSLIRWNPGSGFHDLCTHFHCLCCDSDYCWGMAWDPPMPIIKMNGEISPSDRRKIAKIAKEKGCKVPEFWQSVMVSDINPVVVKVILKCYECHTTKEHEVIIQSGEFRWGRGKYPRGWVGIEELRFNKEDKYWYAYASCSKCSKKPLEV